MKLHHPGVYEEEFPNVAQQVVSQCDWDWTNAVDYIAKALSAARAAGRNEGREEAAQLVKSWLEHEWKHCSQDYVAERIRALKDKEPAQ